MFNSIFNECVPNDYVQAHMYTIIDRSIKMFIIEILQRTLEMHLKNIEIINTMIYPSTDAFDKVNNQKRVYHCT